MLKYLPTDWLDFANSLDYPGSAEDKFFYYLRNAGLTGSVDDMLFTMLRNSGYSGSVIDMLHSRGTYNLFPISEPTSLSHIPVRQNITLDAVASGTFPLSAENAITFGDNSLARFAYMTSTYEANTDYTFSIFVRMDDGSEPVIGGLSTGDFSLVRYGAASSTGNIVTNVYKDVYRCSITENSLNRTNQNFGISKSTSQSAKTFVVTGFQLERSPVVTPYQATGV